MHFWVELWLFQTAAATPAFAAPHHFPDAFPSSEAKRTISRLSTLECPRAFNRPDLGRQGTVTPGASSAPPSTRAACPPPHSALRSPSPPRIEKNPPLPRSKKPPFSLPPPPCRPPHSPSRGRQAPESKGRGKWSTSSYGYAPDPGAAAAAMSWPDSRWVHPSRGEAGEETSLARAEGEGELPARVSAYAWTRMRGSGP